MKKLNVWILMLMLVLVPTFQSCLDDDDQEGFDKVALVTVKALGENDYYFLLDSGKKMYPEEKNGWGNYKVTDGQRAYVYFDIVDHSTQTRADEYDYYIYIGGIENILTKKVIEMTAETKDSIGDNRLKPIGLSVSGGHLNVEYLTAASGTTKHMVNLVENKIKTTVDDEGYTVLEFHLNSFDDYGPLHKGLVSFRLGDFDPSVTGKKGIKLRVRTFDGESYYKLEPKDYTKE